MRYIIDDIIKSKAKERDNKHIFEIPKFWYNIKSFEYLESENLTVSKPIKTSFKLIIVEKGALKNISTIAIDVDAKRMVL